MARNNFERVTNAFLRFPEIFLVMRVVCSLCEQPFSDIGIEIDINRSTNEVHHFSNLLSRVRRCRSAMRAAIAHMCVRVCACDDSIQSNASSFFRFAVLLGKSRAEVRH